MPTLGPSVSADCLRGARLICLVVASADRDGVPRECISFAARVAMRQLREGEPLPSGECEAGDFVQRCIAEGTA